MLVILYYLLKELQAISEKLFHVYASTMFLYIWCSIHDGLAFSVPAFSVISWM